MRLWHQDLLPLLPRAQLLGQHRECAALRGRGWGRPHRTVNYVFRHSPARLEAYHRLVLAEMERRGYRPDPRWWQPGYRGRQLPPWPVRSEPSARPIYPEQDEAYREECQRPPTRPAPGVGAPVSVIYPEHDEAYREACLANLAAKGVQLGN